MCGFLKDPFKLAPPRASLFLQQGFEVSRGQTPQVDNLWWLFRSRMQPGRHKSALLYPVHGRVSQLLLDVVARIAEGHGRHLARRVELWTQLRINSAPVGGNVKLRIARYHLVSQFGIEAHAVLVY